MDEFDHDKDGEITMDENKTLKELDMHGHIGMESNIGGAAGAKHVAELLVHAKLTTVWSPANEPTPLLTKPLPSVHDLLPSTDPNLVSSC